MSKNYTSFDKNNLKINAYLKDPLIHGRRVSATFKAMINPDSFKHHREVEFNKEPTSNSAFDVYQFQGYGKETVAFTIILDGTGYINSTAKTVNEQLNELLNVVYDYQSSSHKAHYTQLHWGHFKFDCHVQNIDVNYTLFDGAGKGLIAEVEMSFIVHRNKKASMKKGAPASPDMTHIHTFKEGDNLPAMCKEIYDDISYYIQIAELNGLSNFRHIPTGKQIVFPPLVNKV